MKKKLVWRSVSQVITFARFRRPAEPKRCNIKRFHTWRWQAPEDDPNVSPFWGMKCQCGLLTWEPRDKPVTAGATP